MNEQPELPSVQDPGEAVPAEESGSAADAAESLPATPAGTWFRRLSSVLFIVFCFELGLFLLIYPWTDAWTENSLSLFAPARFVADWRLVWNNSYFRGAVSGVGVLNIRIALGEVFGMFTRRSR